MTLIPIKKDSKDVVMFNHEVMECTNLLGQVTSIEQAVKLAMEVFWRMSQNQDTRRSVSLWILDHVFPIWDVQATAHVPTHLDGIWHDRERLISWIITFFATGRAPSSDEMAERMEDVQQALAMGKSVEYSVVSGFADLQTSKGDETFVASYLSWILWSLAAMETTGEEKARQAISTIIVLLATTPTYGHSVGLLSGIMSYPKGLDVMMNDAKEGKDWAVQAVDILHSSLQYLDIPVAILVKGLVIGKSLNLAKGKRAMVDGECRCRGGDGFCHVCRRTDFTFADKGVFGIKQTVKGRIDLLSMDEWQLEMERALRDAEVYYHKNLPAGTALPGNAQVPIRRRTVPQRIVGTKLTDPDLDLMKLCHQVSVDPNQVRVLTYEDAVHQSMSIMNKILANVDVAK
jgi:hypothetical protein